MPAQQFLEREDIFREERRILNRIYNSADMLELYLDEALKANTRREAGKLAEKAAFLLAVEEIQDLAEAIIINETRRACIETSEYNYEPYVNQLVGAVRTNLKRNYETNLFTMRVGDNPYYSTIMIDFTPLGTVDEWGEAVKKAKKELGIGKVSSKDILLASVSWRFLYQVDREGKTVTRRSRGGGEESSRDVTHYYEGKYTTTIGTRLSFLPDDKAPYWYIIEHGNKNVNIGEGGIPYPDVSPQHFVDEIKFKILDLLITAYERYLPRVRDLLDDLYKGGDDGDPEFEAWYREIVEEILMERAEILIFPEQKTYRTFTYLDRQFEAFRTSRGNIFFRVRVRGEFAGTLGVI